MSVPISSDLSEDLRYPSCDSKPRHDTIPLSTLGLAAVVFHNSSLRQCTSSWTDDFINDRLEPGPTC